RDISGGLPGTVVPGVKAIWAAGPDGDTGRLHINDEDPFSWVVPHGDVADHVTETPPRTVEQLFGYGPEETFSNERRFDEMFVGPKGQPALLVTDFQPQLLTRVLEAREFRLRFETNAGAAIHVDEVTLYLVVAHSQESPLFSPEAGGGIIRWVGDLYESLKLVAVTLPLSPALDQLTIYSGSKAPLLVYAVRYREARQRTCNWSGKVVLKPGKYQISLSGESEGEAPGLPDSKQTTWNVTDSFDIDYPERLRPYIDETTIGDSRIFQTESKGWDPTMYGFGFPIYQDYYGVVRFHVSYMDQIFSLLRFRLIYERGGQVEQDLVPATGSAAKSWLLDKSKSWISGHCGTPAADQEITLTNPFTKAGAAGVYLLFDHPNGQEVKLDEWSCYVSQFGSFADHLNWPNHCLTVLYSATGRSQRPGCPTLGLGPTMALSQTARLGNRIDPLLIHEAKLPRASSRVSLTDYPLLLEAYPFDDEDGFPAELAFPPASWRLPTTLTGWLQPLDELTGERFARFAAATGAQFNGGGGDVLAGINDTVGQTTIEAVVDSLERPYALWLRTPEPVDWRRVTATLRIRHVEQISSCPSGYEERLPLDLTIDILPSPDATSAFLVGSLNGEYTRLPRGEYDLKLRFDTQTSGLPVLKPRPVVGGTVEEVTLKFIQPAGQRWPQPTSGIVLPAGLIDKLARVLEIHWPLIDELLVDLEHLQTLPPAVKEPGFIDPVPERIRPVEPETAVTGQTELQRQNQIRLAERLAELDETRLAATLKAVGEYDLLPVEEMAEDAGELDVEDGGER
ncbi:MAG: hypothetical protein KDE59_12940, partial [Anaerolineales bacterium]|nr:hypothetical protein [Anaerolineales bacterium]